MLKTPSPYPMVMKSAGYWVEGPSNVQLSHRTQSCPATPMGHEQGSLSEFDWCVKDIDSSHRAYRRYFVGKVCDLSR